MANRHEYDPILRVWIYGGPGEEGFDHTVEGYNFWAGDMARGLVGTMLGDEPSEKKMPQGYEDWTREQGDAFWQEQAEKNLSPVVKEYLELGMEARRVGIEAGIIK